MNIINLRNFIIEHDDFGLVHTEKEIDRILQSWHNEQIEKAAQIGEKYDVVSRCVMEIRGLKL